MHKAIQIGIYDAEGYRTFQTPGDVCDTCSTDVLWVPVTECHFAWVDYAKTHNLINEHKFYPEAAIDICACGCHIDVEIEEHSTDCIMEVAKIEARRWPNTLKKLGDN
jgi:hypothetical protein